MPKVLIIDDEEDIVDLLSYHLERSGFSVVAVGDQESAFHFIKAQTPDLILIHHLPNYADKNSFCKKLKEKLRVQNTCLICLETNLNPSDNRCHNVDACIHIPLLPEKLIKEIQLHYNKKCETKPTG